MDIAKANGIEIAYDTFGDIISPALLLIMGWGGQLIHWQDDLCQKIADSGFHVIRYDNRDVGLSTKVDGLAGQEAMEKAGALFMGQRVEVPYTMEDLADDAAALLDFLKIEKAHICGMSMGGHIAQTFAIRHPKRTASLISIYSSPGNRPEFMPTPEVMEFAMTPAPADRDAYIDYRFDFLKLISGSDYPLDEAYLRRQAASDFDRCFHPDGILRQYLAMLSQKDRGDALGKLNIPALIIHGDDDPMLPIAAGKATADAIPDSKFVVIKGMGHAIPYLDKCWSEIIEAMIAHMKKTR